MRCLGVNIDHVATLRQARGTLYPSVLTAATEAILGGADQITIHLREDRRHIQDHDVFEIREKISVPLNLEMAASREILNIAKEVRPKTATLVPEKRMELTTEGGLDCIKNSENLKEVISDLHASNIEVSLFLDPDIAQINMAKELGADTIEIHTGTYCNVKEPELAKIELEKIKTSAIRIAELNMRICAGHGLNYDNIKDVVDYVPQIQEYNIGHAIIAKSVFVGLKQAVVDIKKLII